MSKEEIIKATMAVAAVTATSFLLAYIIDQSTIPMWVAQIFGFSA